MARIQLAALLSASVKAKICPKEKMQGKLEQVIASQRLRSAHPENPCNSFNEWRRYIERIANK